MKFLGVDIAKLVDKNLSSKLNPATLQKKTEGTRSTANLAGGTQPTTADFDARGFVAEYKEHQIDETLIHKGDRRVVLIANSIVGFTVPEPGDRIIIEGSTYVIQGNGVSRDPASATYTCHCRAV